MSWSAYGASPSSEAADAAPGDPERPELRDFGRFGRMVVRRFVARARADDRPTFRSIIGGHLGVRLEDLGVVEENWPPYEHVNLQRALDAWLSTTGRSHRLLGLADYRHRGEFGLGDLLGESQRMFGGPHPGNLTRVARASGPGGQTHECLRAAVVLVEDRAGRLALLFRGPDHESDVHGVRIEAVADRDGVAAAAASELRELAVQLNVHRGHVVSFGQDVFGERSSVLRFHERPRLSARDLILPAAVFEDVRRQVVGVAANRERLRASGQHLKRGVLLFGPPGVGKTHTVRYLVSQLTDTTIVELTGETLGALREACSIARSLEPAMIVVEDVDLIAEERDHYSGQTPMLFTLLNEMDGLAEDADVVFLLTTNRPDLLEPALAARPGRVDQAVHIDLPDRDARRRLVELYRGSLELDTSRLEDVLDRTDGVTASFLKELLRRAAVVAAGHEAPGSGVNGLRVTAEDLDRALVELLDTRNAMTRAVLGYREG
ncbi:MAG TPA: ATP-binding protein [Nocardioides sp.]|nr:ATP-binding protein [Nocardioides sp.]